MHSNKVTKNGKNCVIMADKDISERDVLKRCFPNASVLICLFHTLRSFRREVTCDKMGILELEATSEDLLCSFRG